MCDYLPTFPRTAGSKFTGPIYELSPRGPRAHKPGRFLPSLRLSDAVMMCKCVITLGVAAPFDIIPVIRRCPRSAETGLACALAKALESG